MIRNRRHLLIFLVILLLGITLRYHNLYIWPRRGATFDEYAWPWLGINIIQNHVPISWSPHQQYQDREHKVYDGTPFWIVRPYLEHPPLFGMVAGSFALLRGASDMYDVTQHTIRPLALLLGAFSIVMIYIFTAELYSRHIALLAAFLYATVPTVVIGSRLVQNENFFIPFFLLSLFSLHKFLKMKKPRWRNTAAIICGLLALAKVPWLAATIAGVLVLLFHKRYRDIIKFLLIVVPIFLLFFVYGFYFDKDLFISLWRLQLARYDLEYTSIFALFHKPYLADRYYLDGWIYFGWFSFILLAAQNFKKHSILIAGFLGYFLIFLAGIPDEPGHGWYRYPFYPFLIIGIALFIKEYFAKNWILTFLFLVFIGTSLLQLTWAPTFGFSYIVFRLCIVTWCLSFIPLFFSHSKAITVGRVVSYGWLVLFALMNIWAVVSYNEL